MPARELRRVWEFLLRFEGGYLQAATGLLHDLFDGVALDDREAEGGNAEAGDYGREVRERLMWMLDDQDGQVVGELARLFKSGTGAGYWEWQDRVEKIVIRRMVGG